MGRELSHFEVRELLGAYALDAVDGEESEAVERHLEECGICRTEVSEHREVASLMAAGWVPAPEGVWDRIASSLEETPPAMRPPASLGAARERRRQRLTAPTRVAVAAGAAVLVAVFSLTVVKVLQTSDRVDNFARPSGLEQVAQEAARRDDARVVNMVSTAGPHSAEAVLLPDGTGYILRANLPRLPEDRTYQLWAVVGPSKISVGVLGSEPGAVAFRAAGDVSALAITEEVAGGVVASDKQPTVVGVVA
ncbi:MAG: anti-sigma factor [Actinomycetota bacterium]